MGLFDIFRRHKKKEQIQPNQTKSESLSAISESLTGSISSSPSTSHSLSLRQAVSSTQESVSHSLSQSTTSMSVSSSDSLLTSATESVAGSSSVANSSESVASNEIRSLVNNSDQQPVAAEKEADTAGTDHQTVEKKYDNGLAKSRHGFGARLNRFLANFRHVDEDFFDDLEDLLIESDVGVDMTTKLSDELRDEVKLQNAKTKQDVSNVIIEKMVDLYEAAGKGENAAINFAKEGPTVIMFVGVNGAGKTTTIGKMAAMYKHQGKKVILAAADTFRAGATEQLDVWAKRDGVDIVTGPENGDPAAVVYDAVKKAQSENYDILLVDTAGRLQNKINLMKELAKMKRVLTREIPAAPHEVLLVVDATTGQNALSQAKLFKQNTDVTGIILTKLDGTARGGIVLAIRNELHLPVKYVGLGEKVDDLQPFNAEEFVYGLFKGLVTTK
ncbi:signal recognition particle-docking protein FtsY [Limosilactobacillus difficilis]|uniref:signal recognition particle-docking protein FtsY n=1 Tax=Limosilactobacillus difficilis TaxID=2991838 RepID=UPI0024B91067|nr:signal recognition particle-docking protein FtsY [Limosilactobacillus difficilis]